MATFAAMATTRLGAALRACDVRHPRMAARRVCQAPAGSNATAAATLAERAVNATINPPRAAHGARRVKLRRTLARRVRAARAVGSASMDSFAQAITVVRDQDPYGHRRDRPLQTDVRGFNGQFPATLTRWRLTPLWNFVASVGARP